MCTLGFVFHNTQCTTVDARAERLNSEIRFRNCVTCHSTGNDNPITRGGWNIEPLAWGISTSVKSFHGWWNEMEYLSKWTHNLMLWFRHSRNIRKIVTLKWLTTKSINDARRPRCAYKEIPIFSSWTLNKTEDQAQDLKSNRASKKINFQNNQIC